MPIDWNARTGISQDDLDRLMRESEMLRAQETGKMIAACARWVKSLFTGRRGAHPRADAAPTPPNPSSTAA